MAHLNSIGYLADVKEWAKGRKDRKSETRNVLVFSMYDYPAVCRMLDGEDDVAYISITATDDCAKYYLHESNEHYVPNSSHVLNVEFDDIEEDREYDGHLLKAMSMDQAREMVSFIEDNLCRDVIVHCRAGRSRSQGVCSFLLGMYPDRYEECAANMGNPCVTPNMHVVMMLKRAYYERRYEVSF